MNSLPASGKEINGKGDVTMNENIQELLKKIADSEELQAQFGKFETLDDAYELASQIQQGFTKEEFLDAVKVLNEAADDDISDEELAATAGGVDTELKVDLPRSNKTMTCVSISQVTTINRSAKPSSIRISC